MTKEQLIKKYEGRIKVHPSDNIMAKEYSIRQRGKTVLKGDHHLKMIWYNLIGRNLKGEEYRKYIDFATSEGFQRGPIVLYKENELIETGEIK